VKTIWQEILNWCALLARNRYVRALEADVARLRAENRALVNSLLGTEGMALAIISNQTQNGQFTGDELQVKF
jgi:hypothetical protein